MNNPDCASSIWLGFRKNALMNTPASAPKVWKKFRHKRKTARALMYWISQKWTILLSMCTPSKPKYQDLTLQEVHVHIQEMEILATDWNSYGTPKVNSFLFLHSTQWSIWQFFVSSLFCCLFPLFDHIISSLYNYKVTVFLSWQVLWWTIDWILHASHIELVHVK